MIDSGGSGAAKWLEEGGVRLALASIIKQADLSFSQEPLGLGISSEGPIDESQKNDDSNAMEKRVTRLEVIAEQNEKRFDRMEAKLDHIEAHIGGEIGRMKWWFVSAATAIIVSLAGLMFALFDNQAQWIQHAITQAQNNPPKIVYPAPPVVAPPKPPETATGASPQ